MVAFCALAAIVTRAPRAGPGSGSGDHDQGALNFGRDILIWLSNVQIYCGEGESRRGAGVSFSADCLEK
jgi:hypothetical protein